MFDVCGIYLVSLAADFSFIYSELNGRQHLASLTQALIRFTPCFRFLAAPGTFCSVREYMITNVLEANVGMKSIQS